MHTEDHGRHRLILAGLVLAKLIIHFFTNSLYGLHRDEYLYLAEGNHLAWGYMEGPPMIGLLAWLSSLFGNSIFVVRLFPALAGCMIVVLVVQSVRHLGGGTSAQLLAGLGLVLSPTLLGTNSLFQPVSFNQLGWVALIYATLRLHQTQDKRWWYGLGVLLGLGLLTKYSILLWAVAICLSWLLLFQRHWLTTKHPYLALCIAFILWVPNLWWQISHSWPLLDHMKALREEQFVHVDIVGFLVKQFTYHAGFAWLWIPGLVTVIARKSYKQYRWVGLTWVIAFFLLIIMQGKAYYLMGAYPILFAFGAIAWEHRIKRKVVFWSLAGFITLTSIPFIPIAVPILPLPQMEAYSGFVQNKVGFREPFVWEDGESHAIRQDYADMHGWEEMVQKVAKVYHALPDSVKATTHIYGDSYGHAGAIQYFGKKYDLPEAESFSASFVIWLAEDFPYTHEIQITDTWQTQSSLFQQITFMDSVENEWARDPGYIFLKTTPLDSMAINWRNFVRNAHETWHFGSFE